MTQQAYLDEFVRDAEEKEFWARMAQVSAEEYRTAVTEDGDRLNDDYGIEEARISGEER